LGTPFESDRENYGEARRGRGKAQEPSALLAWDKFGKPVPEKLAERLLPYLTRSMVFADEGREHELTKVFRKMSVWNPIPSAYGVWSGTSHKSRNIPLQRIIEDPVFKPSHQSFFVQLADYVAFALLKRELPPSEHVKKYRLNEAFESCLSAVCFKRASRTDPLGSSVDKLTAPCGAAQASSVDRR
jgi:hypothetical protein